MYANIYFHSINVCHSFISRHSHKTMLMNPRAILIILLLVSSCQAKTLIVDSGGSGDVGTLSAAISIAYDGDSILIRPGNYPAATVDKRLNITGQPGAIVQGSLILDASGCRISDISLKSSGDDAAVMIASSDNQIERCTISASAKGVYASGENNSILDCLIVSTSGLEIFGAKNVADGCNITSAVASGGIAIRINRTWGCQVRGCSMSADQGVLVEDSHDNIILNNTYDGNGLGVALTRSSFNDISQNRLLGCPVSGIDVDGGRSNTLTENLVSGGKVGISLRGSQGCNASRNICEKNERAGVYCDGDYQDNISGNSLSENGNGLLLQGSVDNILASNRAVRNTYGISLRGCTRNTLRGNNLLNNSYNLRIELGQGYAESSDRDAFVQDIDASNLVDGKPVCYLVGKADTTVPSDCGILGLVSCKNIRAVNLTIKNSSIGVFLVNSTNCNIENCSIASSQWGFLLKECMACIVSRSRTDECITGFMAEDSSGCQFACSFASNCSAEGFRTDASQGMGLRGCVARYCQSGIALHSSRMCRIQDCSACRNHEEGMLLSKSHNCTLIGNDAFSNGLGISLAGSNSALLQQNNVSDNEQEGISFLQLSRAIVQNNSALHNAQGIYILSSKYLVLRKNILGENSRFGLRLSSSEGCNITENEIYGNGIAGVNLVDCTDNQLYHNVFLNNSIQNAVDNGRNSWDAGAEDGGNYWSDHAVFGNPSDVLYSITGGGVDRYPFQDPWGWR